MVETRVGDCGLRIADCGFGSAAESPIGNRQSAIRNPLVSLLILTALGLALYVPGINWGLPGLTSWSQDTVAGARSLGPVEGWPNRWRGRYPPLHYLINVAAYQPLHRYWVRSGQGTKNPESGRVSLAPPIAPKVGLRVLFSRILTVIMAIAAGIGIWAAAMALTTDALAALLSAVTLMVGAAFTYFAHLGNVDIPSMCWFAWSVYFFVRAIRSRRTSHCALLGLFAALAVCTKDGMAGVYPGMALVLVWHELPARGFTGWKTGRSGSARQDGLMDGRRAKPALLASTGGRRARPALRWLVGLAAFILPYLIINGVIQNPGGYLTRMTYWFSDSADTLHARQYRYPNQLSLLSATGWYAAGAVGWPMLAAMGCAVGYGLWRHTRVALTLLVPAASYYLLVIACVSHFVYSRFLFPPLALVAMVTGLAGSALIRDRTKPAFVRFAVPTAVLLLSLGYALAVNVEMVTDSRYAAESWFQEHVEPSSRIGVFSKEQYLPRLPELGYQTGPGVMARETFDSRHPPLAAQGMGHPLPEYLVLTSYSFEDFDDRQQACMADLVAGKLGYKVVVEFGGWRYLGAGSSWLSLAGWGTLPPGKISPRIIILRRNLLQPPANQSEPDGV